MKKFHGFLKISHPTHQVILTRTITLPAKPSTNDVIAIGTGRYRVEHTEFKEALPDIFIIFENKNHLYNKDHQAIDRYKAKMRDQEWNEVPS